MRLTILGGGGFRVPLVYAALVADRSPGRVTTVRLHDTDDTRLRAIARVLKDQAAGHPDAPTVELTTDLDAALLGTDFVFSAIRVGGAAGRSCDEKIGQRHGVIGQETVGIGGISFALRTIPTVVDLAERIARLAPQAWTINFTNPAGLVTEVMSAILGDKVIGICDSPVGLARRVLLALGMPSLGAEIDYVGLNHLGWLRALRVEGVDVLPKLLADPALIESFEEGRLFGAEWIQALGAVPNEYLHYYDYQREVLEADRHVEQTRGAFLAEQQARFYDQVARPRSNGTGTSLDLWERTRLEREATYMLSNRESAGLGDRDAGDLVSGGYETVALALMHAIALDQQARLILNVRNRGSLAELDDDAVVEVPCIVGAGGATPLPNAGLPDFGRGLVVNAKSIERRTIAAGLKGSRSDALIAIAQHPLVDSVSVAGLLLQDCLDSFPELAYLR